ncbi:MAG: hypothetical protein OXG49_18250 [Chloroflexi bacterium]|nr:hypothetical protein [Chloroflexota bacterium]
MAVDFNELPDEVKLPIIAAVGGSVVAAFNHFSAAFKRKSRRADIHVDKIEAEHQLDVGQAALIHSMVDQHLLQENSAFRLMEEEVRANKQTIRELQDERIALEADHNSLQTEEGCAEARQDGMDVFANAAQRTGMGIRRSAGRNMGRDEVR